MLDRVTIASPCPADWDEMPGTDQVRHCSQCNKNVYNLSAMTPRQAEALLQETEGSLCARLYRRADGTILTENCPAGLRVTGRRMSRFAGAAMSAVAALSSAAGAQFPMFPLSSNVAGVVQDLSGAVIPNAKIDFVADGSEKALTLTSDQLGAFHAHLVAGAYTIKIVSPGFESLIEKKSVRVAEQLNMVATLKVGAMMGEFVEIPYAK
jgi:hypothetical protein